MNFEGWLERLARELGVALRRVLLKLLVLLVHLVVRVASGRVGSWLLLLAFDTLELLPIHVATIAVHLHQGTGLLV